MSLLRSFSYSNFFGCYRYASPNGLCSFLDFSLVTDISLLRSFGYSEFFGVTDMPVLTDFVAFSIFRQLPIYHSYGVLVTQTFLVVTDISLLRSFSYSNFFGCYRYVSPSGLGCLLSGLFFCGLCVTSAVSAKDFTQSALRIFAKIAMLKK